MSAVAHVVVPGWEPVISDLRAAGLAVVLETSTPGWWYLRVLTEDPADNVFIGSHPRGHEQPWEDTVDLDGPGDFYVAYRRVTHADGSLSVSADRFTVDATTDALVTVARELLAADPATFDRL